MELWGMIFIMFWYDKFIIFSLLLDINLVVQLYPIGPSIICDSIQVWESFFNYFFMLSPLHILKSLNSNNLNICSSNTAPKFSIIFFNFFHLFHPNCLFTCLFSHTLCMSFWFFYSVWSMQFSIQLYFLLYEVLLSSQEFLFVWLF